MTWSAGCPGPALSPSAPVSGQRGLPGQTLCSEERTEALATGGWPPSTGTEAIKGELLRWAKPRAGDQEKETSAPGEVAPGHQVRAEQQEVGKWCRGIWQVGGRDQTVNKEQIHELCLFTRELPKT